MADNVAYLPAVTTFTVEQALKSASDLQPDIKRLLIIGEDTDGRLIIRSSRMDRGTANYLLDRAKFYTLELTNDHEVTDHRPGPKAG